MNSNPSVEVRSLRDAVSTAEWRTRVDLAACYRLIARDGLTDLIYNHITARVPDAPGYFLINPFGFLYEEITASCLYKIDLDGEVVLRPRFAPGVDFGMNYTGYVIHSAVHGARHDVGCVIHTHSRAGVAVSAMECGMLPLNQTSLRFYNRVGYHDFEGPALNLEERQRLVRDLGDAEALVLRNHGLLACGRSVAEAYNVMHFLEAACRYQVSALAGGKVRRVPDAVAEQTARGFAAARFAAENPFDGRLEWAALTRALDRIDPSYAT